MFIEMMNPVEVAFGEVRGDAGYLAGTGTVAVIRQHTANSQPEQGSKLAGANLSNGMSFSKLKQEVGCCRGAVFIRVCSLVRHAQSFVP
jgi:hypothetical protein